MSAQPPARSFAKSALVALAAVCTVGFAIAFAYVGALWLVGVAIMVGLGAIVGFAMSHRA